MAVFKYTARNADGKQMTGTVNAALLAGNHAYVLFRREIGLATTFGKI